MLENDSVFQRGVYLNVKEYLSQLFWLEDEINTLAMEREYLFASVFKGQAQIKGIASVKLNEYSRRIDNKIIESTKLINEIVEKIENVATPKYRQLLRLRYVIGLKWEEIAEIMNCDSRRVYRIHAQALKEFDDNGYRLKSEKKLNQWELNGKEPMNI